MIFCHALILRNGRVTAIKTLALTRAANSVDFYIEVKFEFEFSLFYELEFKIFIFASSSSSSSPVKIYQVFSSSENKVIDLV